MIDLYTVMAYHFADATAEVDRVAAVSYTHLDVYKRQTHKWQVECLSCGCR